MYFLLIFFSEIFIYYRNICLRRWLNLMWHIKSFSSSTTTNVNLWLNFSCLFITKLHFNYLILFCYVWSFLTAWNKFYWNKVCRSWSPDTTPKCRCKKVSKRHQKRGTEQKELLNLRDFPISLISASSLLRSSHRNPKTHFITHFEGHFNS